MFDFVRNVKLSLSETVRRTAFKVAGGAVIVVGAGFLLASLWSYLAVERGWGSTLASLSIGGAFVIIGLIAMMIGGRRKHPMPTTDDLRHEVEARVNLAADAAIGRARDEATKFIGHAEDRVNSLLDTASYRAGRVVGDAERTVYGMARDAYSAATNATRSAGFTRENVEAAQDTVRDYADKAQRAADTNAGSMAKLLGAFAVGVTVASKLQDWRHGDELSDDEIADLYDAELREDFI
ncbi:phage holin family protein [Paracoccus sp. TK19116]|uniref:Phage holin family protein n=1 Tax=Paracoccus albicereus TaxID=2922394 RepID=A0ABT1MP61_9RHOB|nr:phage holin family protein [Paracoccus albicereus]MCQ0969971.1 phage holin family protein [Paracoccus albicereus]